mmetsp:Transcript_51231/g.120393  ORF Transcript_51231/g.120393 Transcript_51231/m.120393 type:complete len:228 (-) Transcript_51231:890-1573(-)
MVDRELRVQLQQQCQHHLRGDAVCGQSAQRIGEREGVRVARIVDTGCSTCSARIYNRRKNGLRNEGTPIHACDLERRAFLLHPPPGQPSERGQELIQEDTLDGKVSPGNTDRRHTRRCGLADNIHEVPAAAESLAELCVQIVCEEGGVCSCAHQQQARPLAAASACEGEGEEGHQQVPVQRALVHLVHNDVRHSAQRRARSRRRAAAAARAHERRVAPLARGRDVAA